MTLVLYHKIVWRIKTDKTCLTSDDVETFTSLCSEFIQETVYQILLESPEFYGRYYKKNILVFFSGHSV